MRDARVGKSYEELFGDRAEEERRKRGDSTRGKTYEDIYGDKAEEQRKKRKAGNEAASSEKSKKMKELWQDSEYRKRNLESRAGQGKIGLNGPEARLFELLKKLFPNQWRYVGDRSFWLTVDGRSFNPDFININGQKKLIELFGDYWHGEERTGIFGPEHEQDRIDLFHESGYQTLIIWEHELQDVEKLAERLVEFNDLENLRLGLERICRSKDKDWKTVREASNLLSYSVDKLEHGNIEYKILLPTLLEKISEMVYEL